MKTDFIIIGTGLAGLTSALTLAPFGNVFLVSKGKLTESATNLAQGGIAAVVNETDSFSAHIQDTLTAGAWHNTNEAVEFLVKHGPDAISWLEKQGVDFDRIDNEFALGQEGAHSARRILHATDFTGRIVVQSLFKKIRKINNIQCLENTFFLDLLVKNNRSYGVQLIKNGEIVNYFSKATILATGGLGQLYFWTTNPKVATGDGIAAGYRAGTKLKDLEFIQFHPTALQYRAATPSTSSGSSDPLFLLSEAIRGEGAYLVNEKGRRFMEDRHPLKELAPRDILARAIFREQNNGKVYLDIRHKGESFLRNRFPNTYEYLLTIGYNMAKDLLPVTPAAHYSCGGIAVNLQGQTNIDSLFAFGEVSCTGAQGANRLASNSLLEAVVFPLQLPKSLKQIPGQIEEINFPLPIYETNIDFPDIKQQLQKLMWEQVGIVRTKVGLLKAQTQLSEWEKQLLKINNINEKFAETKNLVTAAKLITEMAIQRKESLGAHYLESSI